MGSMLSNEFLFSFKGRINRAKYWYAVFASSISCLVFMGIVAAAIAGIFGVGVKSVDLDLDVFRHPLSLPFRVSFSNAGPTSTAALSFYAFGAPIFAAGAWFLAATTIKRLHDRNKSGWWIVPFFVAPPLLQRLWDWLDNPDLALLVSALAFGLGVWSFVELFFLSGAKAPNRFGPDPLAPEPVATGTASRWDQHSELEFVPHSAGPSPGPHGMRGHE
jgi:uncharacterized membrane protein YhaH (DUF805 family)